MLLIREVMHCKPGNVRPMVEKFLAMSKLGEKAHMPKMKAMTDVSAGTVVAEMEVENLAAFEKMMSPEGMSAEHMKQFAELMKGYHDLVDHGRREIYKIEGKGGPVSKDEHAALAAWLPLRAETLVPEKIIVLSHAAYAASAPALTKAGYASWIGR